MKVLSLFDGISTGRLALENAGIPVDAYYASEIDESTIKILEELQLEIVEKNGVKFATNTGKGISEQSMELAHMVDGEVRITQATKQGYIVAEPGDGVNISFPTSKTRRGRVIKGKSSTLDTDCDVCVYTGEVIRKFTLTELERLQNLPDGYTEAEGVTETARRKAIGNGWTTDIITHIFSYLGGKTVKRKDPTTKETRKASYEAVLPKVKERSRLILKTLGSRQMTVSEITDELVATGKIPYYNRNYVAPRLTELKDMGVVETCGRRKSTHSTATEAIWRRTRELQEGAEYADAETLQPAT